MVHKYIETTPETVISQLQMLGHTREQLESIFLGEIHKKKFGKINKGNEFYPDSRARNRRMRPQPEGARGIVPPPRRQPRQAACGQAGGGR